jgi:hypothetical protein
MVLGEGGLLGVVEGDSGSTGGRRRKFSAGTPADSGALATGTSASESSFTSADAQGFGPEMDLTPTPWGSSEASKFSFGRTIEVGSGWAGKGVSAKVGDGSTEIGFSDANKGATDAGAGGAGVADDTTSAIESEFSEEADAACGPTIFHTTGYRIVLKAMHTPTITTAANVGKIFGMALVNIKKTHPAFQPYTTQDARQANRKET